jgi:hypothetical protein
MRSLAWPLNTTHEVEEGYFSEQKPVASETLLILDFSPVVTAQPAFYEVNLAMRIIMYV